MKKQLDETEKKRVAQFYELLMEIDKKYRITPTTKNNELILPNDSSEDERG